MTRRQDVAGAETIGAILLFGLFVGVIALLNLTAVPQAGHAAEVAHFDAVLQALNELQATAEAANSRGATASQALTLSPEQSVGNDFFSFFLATPVRASGQLRFDPGYGNLTLSHTRAGNTPPIVDVGSPVAPFPTGRLLFDPHAHFQPPQVASVEAGAILTQGVRDQALRFAPPISLRVDGDTTNVTVHARILQGPAQGVGGAGQVRLRLTVEAATLNAPARPNADEMTLRLETGHGRAWGEFFNATAQRAGLTSPTGYATTVQLATGARGADVVTWRVSGTGTGNDIRLTTGLTVYEVSLG